MEGVQNDSEIKQKNKLWLVAAFIFCIFLLVWIFFIAPYITALPKDFNYEASIISLDNFYDEENRKYFGEERSVTEFSYKTIENEGNISIINNTFSVRTISGDPIVSIERQYRIDRKIKAHTSGHGDKERNGYLFAPARLKKGEPFTYWHINYDAPAVMKFIKEEVLVGLKVYRYETQYENQTVDQTENLTFLPDVGITRGVILEPKLNVWVEPITGRMVKYEDKTTAYYYDLETGEKLHPWNSFSNRFEFASIVDHVEIAKELKRNSILLENTIPLVLGGLILFMILLFFRMPIVAVVSMIVVIIGSVIYLVIQTINQVSNEKITVGISRWVPEGNSVYDENIRGFKDGLKLASFNDERIIEYLEFTAMSDRNDQIKIAQKLLEEDVDLVYSLTTPGTEIIKDTILEIPIVFSVVTYPVEANLIASLKNSENNLVGTRNWVAMSELLKPLQQLVSGEKNIAVIRRKGETNSTIQFEEMKIEAEKNNFVLIDIAVESELELKNELEKRRDEFNIIFSSCDTLVQGEAEDSIIAFAKKYMIPSFSCNFSGPGKGDLYGVVADFYEIGRQAGEKAALILAGVSPSVLETDTVTKPKLIINKKTADTLGIVIPQELISKADVILQ